MPYALTDLAKNSQVIELEELGYYLPIGYWDFKQAHRYEFYQINKFNGHLELFLAELETRYQNSDRYLNLVYGLFLGRLISHLDNQALDNFDLQKDDLIQNLYLADIIAIILKIRLEYQGWEIGFNSICPCDREYKITPKEAGYHDLSTVALRIWLGDNPPQFELNLNRRTLILEPPRFRDLPEFRNQYKDLEYQNRIALSCLDLSVEEFYNLPTCDRNQIVHWANRVANFSADSQLEMDCPKCGREWQAPLILGENYEDFYLRTLSAPKLKEGTFEDYLNRVAAILVIGENAPLKSIQEVYELTATSRKTWVEQMQNYYEQQKKELDKAKSKK